MTGRALVDYGRLLDVLDIEVELMAAAAHGVEQATPVPGCPGLTVGETVRHVGSVYRHVYAWLQDGRRPAQWQRAPASGETLEGFLRTGSRSLVTHLADHPAGQFCPTWWWEDETYGFWRRRMAHETTVHRVDVQAASRAAISPIDRDLALDGIDEILTLWWLRRLEIMGVTGTREATVAVRSGGREWLASAGPAGTSVARVSPGTVRSDAVISAEPMAVYLWLWGRVPPTVVSSAGDEDAVAQLWALLRLATR